MSYFSDRDYLPDDNLDRFYYNILFKKGQKILDIGCSTGNFIAQDPKNIIGLEVDKDAIKVSRSRGFKVVEMKGRKLPFKSNTMENVHTKHVLEHIEDSLFFMKEVFRIMKKNGRLVLITDKYTKRFWDHYSHVRPYTIISLKKLAYDAGFRRYKIYDFPAHGVPGLNILQRNGIFSPQTARKIYLLFGKYIKGENLLMEAIK